MVCDALYFGRQVRNFSKTCGFRVQARRRRLQACPKWWLPTTKLRVVTHQKTEIFEYVRVINNQLPVAVRYT